MTQLESHPGEADQSKLIGNHDRQLVFDSKQLEHSQHSWEAVKAHIVKLYIQQDAPLYEKNDLVRLAEQCYGEGKPLPAYDATSGKLYDWHKVKRRDWEAGVRDALWKKLKLPSARPPSKIALHITDTDPTYILVCHIQDYFRSTHSLLQSGTVPNPYTLTARPHSRMWEMPVLFQDAIRLVEHGSDKLARLKFDEAGVMLQAYLNNMPFTLLPQLLRVVMDQKWSICVEYQAVVFPFIRRLFSERLGRDAPLSKFIFVLLELIPERLAREAIWRCVLDALSNVPTLSPLDTEEMRFRYFWALSDGGYDDSVVRFCNKAIKETYDSPSNTSMQHLRRKWRYHLGTVLEQQDQLEQAEEMYKDAIHEQMLQGDDTYYNNIHVEALRSLGGLCLRKKQYKQAANWYQQAFDAAARLRGPGNARALLCLDQLFVALESLGAKDDIAKLYDAYPISCHHLKRFGSAMPFIT
ncbi:hypothetical protein LTS08_000623 [Lithohypha guttulata]|nr:hypothetical protein LTS08_000623 [Lithohypha guttulata]